MGLCTDCFITADYATFGEPDTANRFFVFWQRQRFCGGKDPKSLTRVAASASTGTSETAGDPVGDVESGSSSAAEHRGLPGTLDDWFFAWKLLLRLRLFSFLCVVALFYFAFFAGREKPNYNSFYLENDMEYYVFLTWWNAWLLLIFAPLILFVQLVLRRQNDILDGDGSGTCATMFAVLTGFAGTKLDSPVVQPYVEFEKELRDFYQSGVASEVSDRDHPRHWLLRPRDTIPRRWRNFMNGAILLKEIYTVCALLVIIGYWTLIHQWHWKVGPFNLFVHLFGVLPAVLIEVLGSKHRYTIRKRTLAVVGFFVFYAGVTIFLTFYYDEEVYPITPWKRNIGVALFTSCVLVLPFIIGVQYCCRRWRYPDK